MRKEMCYVNTTESNVVKKTQVAYSVQDYVTSTTTTVFAMVLNNI